MLDNEKTENKKFGYINLWRSITKWEWYTEVNTFKVFIHLLLKANHKKLKWRGVTVNRGELITSRAHLAIETGLSVQQVRTAIKNLELTNEITRKTTSHYSVIAVKNYEFYQELNQQSTNNQPTLNQRLTTNNNDNNDNNDNNNINSSCSSSCILEEKKRTSTTSNNDISDLNPERIRDLKNLYGEYSNVYLTSRQYDSLKTMILNDNTLNILINQLSEKIETGKEKLYDEKTPAIHYIRLKKYWEYYKNKKAEADEEKPPDFRPEWMKIRDKKLENAFAYLDELAAQDEKMKEDKK